VSIQSLALGFKVLKTENCLQKTGFCVDFRQVNVKLNKNSIFSVKTARYFHRSQLTFRLLHNQ
jgi:hypothetical protein